MQFFKNITRQLYKEKKYSLTVILSLTISLAALISCWNVLSHILFYDSGYKNSQELFVVEGEFEYQGIKSYRHTNWTVVKEWLNSSDIELSAHFISLYTLGKFRSGNYSNYTVGYATSNYFDILGVKVAYGRGFDERDKLDSGSLASIVSYETWLEHGGSDTFEEFSFTTDDVTYNVVGVLPKDFKVPSIYLGGAFGDVAPSIWLTVDHLPSYASIIRSVSPFFALFGRSNIENLENLASELTDVSEEYYKNFGPQDSDWTMTAHVNNLNNRVMESASNTIKIIFYSIFLLLLIVFFNVLLLTRAKFDKLKQSYAIRIALGAKKQNLFISLFWENMKFIGIASLIAVLLSIFVLQGVKEVGSLFIPESQSLQVDFGTILFALFFCFFLNFLLTLISYQTVYPSNLKQSLQVSSKGGVKQVSRISQSILIFLQVTSASIVLILSVNVLIYSGFLLSNERGFSSKNIYFIGLDLSVVQKRLGENTEGEEFSEYNEILNKIYDSFSTLQGVKGVVPANQMPLTTYRKEVLKEKGDKIVGRFYTELVGQGYFELLGIETKSSLKESTSFSDERNEIIISSEIADEITQEPLGSILYLPNDTEVRVTKVVKDTYYPGNDAESVGRYYRRLDLNRFGGTRIGFLLKSMNKETFKQEHIEKVLSTINEHIAVSSIKSLDDYLNEKSINVLVGAFASGTLSVLTLLIACVGIYGMYSYSVGIRKRELGIRFSLGATKATIVNMLVKENIFILAAGMILSVIVTLKVNDKIVQSVTAFPLLDLKFLLSFSFIIFLIFSLLTVLPIYMLIKNGVMNKLNEE